MKTGNPITPITKPAARVIIIPGGPSITNAKINKNLYRFGYLYGSLCVNYIPGHPHILYVSKCF